MRIFTSALICIILLGFLNVHAKAEFGLNLGIQEGRQEFDTMSLMFPEFEKKDQLLIINEMKGNDDVRDATVVQDGVNIRLYLVVGGEITKKRAIELGERFIRLAKAASKDFKPNKDIGKGIYNYIIQINYPNKRTVLIGNKVCTEKIINWT